MSLKVGLLILLILVISVQTKIVIIDTNRLRKNAPNITKWVIGILLGCIVKSLFK